MRIVNRAHLPWFIFVVAATFFATWLYIGNFTPQTLPSALRLPDSLLQKPSEHHRVGGTPLGLIFGTIALSIFVFAALLGVRKKIVLWRIGTVQRWLRAHIWLTLLTIPLVILHSGFRLGGPMTTLIIILYVIVMVSGIYGLVLQHYMPAVMMERLPAESVYEQVPHIRAQNVALDRQAPPKQSRCRRKSRKKKFRRQLNRKPLFHQRRLHLPPPRPVKNRRLQRLPNQSRPQRLRKLPLQPMPIPKRRFSIF